LARPGWSSDAVPGAGDAVAVALRPRPARISAPKSRTRKALLHRHALGQVARLVDGTASAYDNPILFCGCCRDTDITRQAGLGPEEVSDQARRLSLKSIE